MIALLQIRRSTSTEWNTYNTILGDGEPGLDTTRGELKIGDGTTPWATLPVYAAAVPAVTGGPTDWGSLLNVPTVFPPEVHTHVATDITDFAEALQDLLASSLAAGTGVTIDYNDALGLVTINSTGGGGGGSTDPEIVRDTIAGALVGTGLVAVVANDAADTITISTTATQNAPDAALRDRATHTGTQPVSTLSDSTSTGRNVLTAASQAAARAAIGAGTSDLVIGTTGLTAKAGNYAPTLADAPAGSVFAAPLDGSTNTNAAMVRPSARMDIFFVWNSTVQPTNMLTGDQWDIPASSSGALTQTSLDAKVSKTGDTMTGVLTVPGLILAYAAKTASYAITAADYTIDANATTGAFAVTLPTAIGRAGRIFVVRKSDASANAITVNTTSGQTINGAATRTISAQYAVERYQSDGANWMIL